MRLNQETVKLEGFNELNARKDFAMRDRFNEACIDKLIKCMDTAASHVSVRTGAETVPKLK